MWRHQGIQIPEQAASELATLESNDSQSDIIRAAAKEARRKRKEILQLKKTSKRLRTEKGNDCEVSNVAKDVTQVSYLVPLCGMEREAQAQVTSQFHNLVSAARKGKLNYHH